MHVVLERGLVAIGTDHVVLPGADLLLIGIDIGSVVCLDSLLDRHVGSLGEVGPEVDLLNAALNGLGNQIVTGTGAAVQNQRYVDALSDRLEQLELEVRGALVGAMGGADGNCQAVDARLLDKGNCLFRMGQAGVTGLLVLDALANMTQLGLNGNANGMGDL